MKNGLAIFILCSILNCCKEPLKDRTDMKFIEQSLAGFPNLNFYLSRQWVIEDAYAIDGEVKLNLSAAIGDTVISARLEKIIVGDSTIYLREMQVLYSENQVKHRVLVKNEYDTIYHFYVAKLFEFSADNRDDTASFTFVAGKYNYIHEYLYYDTCQLKLYLLDRDSLSKVRGNTLREIPRCQK